MILHRRLYSIAGLGATQGLCLTVRFRSDTFFLRYILCYDGGTRWQISRIQRDTERHTIPYHPKLTQEQITDQVLIADESSFTLVFRFTRRSL